MIYDLLSIRSSIVIYDNIGAAMHRFRVVSYVHTINGTDLPPMTFLMADKLTPGDKR